MAAGRLNRFGFIDPDNGGRVRSGTIGIYYRGELGGSSLFKVDGYVTRSLFDLWSNFTFFLANPEFGDEIQQHDSRLQQGANAQYLRPYAFSGGRGLLTLGGNVQSFQTNVGLYPSTGRNPNRTELTRANPADCPSNNNPGQMGLPQIQQPLLSSHQCGRACDHATPGYPSGVTIGLTFRFGEK